MEFEKSAEMESSAGQSALYRLHSLSEDFFSKVFSVMAEGLVVQDQQGQIISSNAAAEAILGLTRDQLLGRSSLDPRWRAANQWGEPIPGEEHPAMVTLRTGKPVRGFLMRVDRPDGSVAWLKINSELFCERAGAEPHVVCSFTEVTALRQIQDRLQQSEQAIRLTLENSLDAVVSVNQRGRVLEWNRSAERILGWKRREVLGRQVDRLLLLPAEQAKWQRELRRINRGHVGPLMENVYQTVVLNRSREEVPVEVIMSVVCTASGKRITAFLRDVSERILANQATLAARREAEMHRERLELALLAGKLSCWDWQPTAGKVRLDASWAAQVGESLEQLGDTTDTWLGRMHPDDVDGVMEKLNPVLNGDADYYQATFRLRHRRGYWVWLQANGRVVQRDDEGKPLRMVGIQLDVSEQKAREFQLAELRDRADAANQAKSEFLANMSHEIRTPLTAILGFTDLLEQESLLADERNKGSDTIQTIRRAGDHLLNIINDVLDLSKIESGQLQVDSVQIRLDELLRDVLVLMQARAAEKGIALKFVLETPIPNLLRTDPTRFRQVLINLIGNATKFTDQGAVTIYVRVVNFTSTLGRDEDSCELQLDVHDTGAGMSSAQAAKLFQPFEQGDSSITRRYGGSGLGLVISRRLARLMCGDVRLLSSQPGVGSSFRLSLVIESTAPQDGWIHSLDTASPQALAKPPKLLAKYPQLHGRILLVEDGIDNQRLLRAILGKAGADVSVADNGQLALQAFEQAVLSDCPFQLILTDLQMPAMDGLTLTRRLREQRVVIPIIALTAHAMAEDRQRCLAAGCDDYATKPIRIPELLATCAHWLGLRGGVSDQAAGNPKSGYNSPKISNNCPLT